MVHTVEWEWGWDVHWAKAQLGGERSYRSFFKHMVLKGKVRADGRSPWAWDRWDTSVRMSPVLEIVCQKKLWEGDCAWNSYEVSKRSWGLRSCRSIELGTLSCSRGQPKGAHGNYFCQQWRKGGLVWEQWEVWLQLVNPLKCLQPPGPVLPLCTWRWVSRAGVWSDEVTGCCALASSSGCLISF